MTGGNGKVKRGKLVDQMEKAAEEAWEEGKNPIVALRYYDPASPLSDPEGWIDLVVRVASDDAEMYRRANSNV